MPRRWYFVTARSCSASVFEKYEEPSPPGKPFFPEFKLPDTDAIRARLKQPMGWESLAYTPNVEPPTLPADLTRPISVFGGIRAELKQAYGPSPAATLKAAHAEEKRLREFLFVVIARQIPVKAEYLEKLSGVFHALDQALSPLEPASPKRALPVRELAEDRRVHPVVGRLTVRGGGASESTLRQWLPMLRAALGKQAYLKVA